MSSALWAETSHVLSTMSWEWLTVSCDKYSFTHAHGPQVYKSSASGRACVLDAWEVSMGWAGVTLQTCRRPRSIHRLILSKHWIIYGKQQVRSIQWQVRWERQPCPRGLEHVDINQCVCGAAIPILLPISMVLRISGPRRQPPIDPTTTNIQLSFCS